MQTLKNFVKDHQGKITVRIFNDVLYEQQQKEFLNCKVTIGSQRARVTSEGQTLFWLYKNTGPRRSHVDDGSLRFCITNPEPKRFVQIVIPREEE